MSDFPKTRKVRAYIPEKVIVEKPKTYQVKRYLHTEASGGFWCYMRDQKLTDTQANDTTAKSVEVMFYLGHNPVILERWQDVFLEDEKGNTYRIHEKPDEYNYRYGDMKLAAVRCKDETWYNEVRYDDAV